MFKKLLYFLMFVASTSSSGSEAVKVCALTLLSAPIAHQNLPPSVADNLNNALNRLTPLLAFVVQQREQIRLLLERHGAITAPLFEEDGYTTEDILTHLARIDGDIRAIDDSIFAARKNLLDEAFLETKAARETQTKSILLHDIKSKLTQPALMIINMKAMLQASPLPKHQTPASIVSLRDQYFATILSLSTANKDLKDFVAGKYINKGAAKKYSVDRLIHQINVATGGHDVIHKPATLPTNENYILVNMKGLLTAIDNFRSNAMQASNGPSGLSTIISIKPWNDIQHITTKNRRVVVNQVLKDATYVGVSIVDKGPGISPETLKILFNGSYYTTNERGTGVGLETVADFAMENDGFIEVETDVGAGSTFTIWLPLVNDKDVMQNPGTNDTIVLIDDDRTITHVVERFLTNNGYVVAKFALFEDALGWIQTYPDQVAFVLSDNNVSDGMDLSSFLKNMSEKRLAHIPIATLSGDTVEHERVLFSVKKPPQYAELKSVIEAVLGL